MRVDMDLGTVRSGAMIGPTGARAAPEPGLAAHIVLPGPQKLTERGRSLSTLLRLVLTDMARGGLRTGLSLGRSKAFAPEWSRAYGPALAAILRQPPAMSRVLIVPRRPRALPVIAGATGILGGLAVQASD